MASQSTHIFWGGGGMPPDPPKCVYAKHAARRTPLCSQSYASPPPPPPPLNPHSQALIITYNRVLSTSTSITSDEKLDKSLGTRLLIPRNRILIIMMSGKGPDFEYINPAMLSNFDSSYQ